MIRPTWKGETYNVVASDLVGLAPGAHDVGIVVGQDGDNVDTLLTELGESLDVAGDVSGRADGSESTWTRACQTTGRTDRGS